MIAEAGFVHEGASVTIRHCIVPRWRHNEPRRTVSDAARRNPKMTSGLTRRALLRAALPGLVLGPLAARAADSRVPIADMHSHFGIITRPTLPSADFAAELRAQRVALIAWSLPSDFRWIRAVDTGIEQAREPAAGELSAFFRDRLGRMKAYVARSGLRPVLAGADVDACLAGDSGVVLASEGADFLEGRVEDLGAFYTLGLRHVQLVHYIRNPISDSQTMAPVHNGLSTAGRRLVEACNERGILVDLAHCSWPAVERALEVAKKPVVWSHSWVDRTEGRWQDGVGYLQRRLSLAQAKKIAERGGVVGLWGLGLGKPGPSRTPGQGNWTVGRGDTRGYAREIANLVNWLGADHVGIGTDIEGVGTSWSVNDYSQVRSVVEALQDMKLPASAIEQVACGNYARVLKAALKG
jgi:membrane dipeptidase